MSQWYDKYMTIYGKPFSEVPQEVIDGTRERLAHLQSPEPLASIVVIGYNEETHLQALAAKLIYMINHPEERIRMGSQAKLKSEQYQIEFLARKWKNLFESL